MLFAITDCPSVSMHLSVLKTHILSLTMSADYGEFATTYLSHIFWDFVDPFSAQSKTLNLSFPGFSKINGKDNSKGHVHMFLL